MRCSKPISRNCPFKGKVLAFYIVPVLGISYHKDIFLGEGGVQMSMGRMHCKKKETVSALWRDIALHMADDSLSSERNIFTATHSVFLHQIDRGALPSTRRGFFPAYRMGIGKYSNIVGKIPTLWEKFWHGGKNSSLEMWHGRKNSHIVGKIPTWSE